MPEDEVPLDEKQIATRSKHGSWVEWLFRNAPEETRDKALAGYWRAIEAVWQALCLTVAYVFLYGLEYIIFSALSLSIKDTLAQSPSLANMWRNIQTGITFLTIIGWAGHVLVSTGAQLALDLNPLLGAKRKR